MGGHHRVFFPEGDQVIYKEGCCNPNTDGWRCKQGYKGGWRGSWSDGLRQKGECCSMRAKGRGRLRRRKCPTVSDTKEDALKNVHAI